VCASASAFSLLGLGALTTGDQRYWGFLWFLGFLLFLVPAKPLGEPNACPIK
jgi:hypothetical protein